MEEPASGNGDRRTPNLIPGAVVSLVCDAFDGDRVDDKAAAAIRDAVNRWHDRRRPPRFIRRTGVVNRWKPGEPFGFAIGDDADRTSWYISESDIPDGMARLNKGTRIVFLGDPTPEAGHRYPRAHRVEVLTGDGAAVSG